MSCAGHDMAHPRPCTVNLWWTHVRVDLPHDQHGNGARDGDVRELLYVCASTGQPIPAMHWSRFAATHQCSDQKTSAAIDAIARSRSSSETSMWAECNKSSTRTVGGQVEVARNRTTTADAGVCGTEWNSVKYSKERVNVVHQFAHREAATS
jgi:hypothetical protein